MILRGENMIKTTNMILEELRSYANPKAKLSRMANQGECFRITRGLYETNKNTPGYLLAGSIYGPSYISIEYALAYYNLIPEAVYTITCATFEKKKKKLDNIDREIVTAMLDEGEKIVKETLRSYNFPYGTGELENSPTTEIEKNGKRGYIFI